MDSTQCASGTSSIEIRCYGGSNTYVHAGGCVEDLQALAQYLGITVKATVKITDAIYLNIRGDHHSVKSAEPLLEGFCWQLKQNIGTIAGDEFWKLLQPLVLRCRDNAFSSCTEVLQYMTQHSSQQPAWQQQLQQPDKLQQQLDQQLQQFTRQAFADTVLPIHQFAAVLCCKVAALILADQTSPQPFTRHLTKRRREWVTQLSQFTFISRVVWRCSNMCRPTAAVLGQQAAQLGPELLQLAYAAPPHCCHTAAMVGSATAAESAVDVRCLLALLCSSNYLQHETADEASILQALTQLLCQPHPGGQLPEQQQGSSNQEYQQPLVDQATVECWLQQQGLIMQALMSAAAEPAVTHHTSCCTLCGVVADSEGQEAVQCGYCCHSYHLSCARDEAMFAAGPEVDPAAAPAGKAKCLGCQGFPWSELGRRHVLYGESVHDALQAASGPAIAAAAAGYAPGATPSRRGRSAGDRNAARAAVRGRAAAYVDHNQATCIGRRSADGSVTDSSPAHFTAPTAAAAAAGSTYRNRSLPFSRKHALYIVGQRAAEKHQDNAAAEDVITGGDAEGKCSRAMSAAAAVGAADGEDDECNWPCQQRGQPAVISTATAPSSEHALRELLQAVVATAAAGRCMPNTAKDLLKYGLLPKGTAIDYIKDRVVLQCFTVRGASGRQQKLQCTTCAATFDSLSACEVHCRGGTTRHASNRLFVHGMEHSLAKLVQHHLPAMRQEVYLQSQQQQQQPGSADVAGCSARPGSTPAADIHGGSRLSMMQQQPVQPTPYPASAASKSPEQEQQEEHEVQRHKPATKRKHPDCADCGVDLCNQQQCIKRWRQALEALQQLLSDNRHTLPELVEQKQQQMQQQAAGPLKQPQQADTGLGGTGNEQWQPAHHCSALTQNSTSMVTLDADDDADVAGEDGEVVQQVHGSDTVQDPAAVTIGGLQQQGAGGSLQQLCDVRQTGQRDHPPQPQQQQGVPAVDLQQVEQSAQPPLTASASAAQLAQCCSPQAGPAAVGSAGNVHLGTPVTGAEAFLSSSPAAVAAASVAAVYTLGAIHAADASH